ncbi:methionine ABC transporter permease [Arthrobacter ginkgonis]|uniref:methionine ABC transporter permease n=1 Tax=Arthrobacter ginkgonis TaxID=1630594 RepID=UPI0031E70B3F
MSVAAALPANGATAFDLNRVVELLPEIAVAMGQTFAMLLVAIPLAVLVGTPLGIWLYSMSPVGLKPRPKLHKVVDGLVNTMRSFPFLILLIAIIPITRFIVGTTIGTAAVIVPLTINAIPYFARFVEQNLTQLGGGVVEAARAMGATRGQIVRDVLLVEAKPALVGSITIMTVSFISYSAMAGLVGGGGIGDFAIRYGYYRYETGVMFLAIILMIVLVQAVQIGGTRLARRFDKRR